VKIYGEIQSGNCYKVKLLTSLLAIEHEGGFDLSEYPSIQQWIDRIQSHSKYVGME